MVVVMTWLILIYGIFSAGFLLPSSMTKTFNLPEQMFHMATSKVIPMFFILAGETKNNC